MMGRDHGYCILGMDMMKDIISGYAAMSVISIMGK